MKITISIADDHPLIINGLKNLIARYPEIVVLGTYPNGRQLIEGLSNNTPDVLLLDIHMPIQAGDEAAKVIAAKYPSVSIIALTNLDNIYYIKSMLQHGVLGYILKSSSEDNLINAIRKVSKGEQFLDPLIKERLQQDKKSIRRQTARGTLLTRREKEILQLIGANYTSQEIADKLFVSKRTIDSHRLNLLFKLEVKNTAALLVKAIQLGLLD